MEDASAVGKDNKIKKNINAGSIGAYLEESRADETYEESLIELGELEKIRQQLDQQRRDIERHQEELKVRVNKHRESLNLASQQSHDDGTAASLKHLHQDVNVHDQFEFDTDPATLQEHKGDKPLFEGDLSSILIAPEPDED